MTKEKGRPTKLTTETVEKITNYIKLGNDNKVAAALAGVGESTFYLWLAKAEEEDAESHYVDFLESIQQAQAAAEARAVSLVQKAATDGKWQASTWWLERKHPERWGQTNKIKQEITGADGAPLALTDDEMKAAVLGLLRGGNGSITDRDDSETTSE